MSRLKADRILEVIQELGVDYKEKNRTIYATCPGCGEMDKLSILKDGGSVICYRGSCSFGGPRSFVDWVMQSASVDKVRAISIIYGTPSAPLPGDQLQVALEDKPKGPPAKDSLVPLMYPEVHAHPIVVPESAEGVQYLKSRGINVSVAAEYWITYSSLTRRVVIPIVMNGVVYGWQARAIDPVVPGLRMRNNPGFQRARTVMFYDRLLTGQHAIIAEGPFDALKFHLCGGNVCTMGKIITDEQLRLILDKKPSAIYLALDDDAAVEMMDLQNRIQIPLFRINVPEQVKERCAKEGKKYDFGECSMEECLQAFKEAIPFDATAMAVYLRED